MTQENAGAIGNWVADLEDNGTQRRGKKDIKGSRGANIVMKEGLGWTGRGQRPEGQARDERSSWRGDPLVTSRARRA